VPLTAISIKGYRSIPNLYLQVEPCSVFVGENGVGKSNLYKALGLLRAAAEGTITRAIAQEGGVESVLWAGGGRMRREPVRLILKADIDHLRYEVEIGLPSPAQVAFRSNRWSRRSGSSPRLPSARSPCWSAWGRW